MRIEFTKMEGAGNDFVVLDNLDGRLQLDVATVRRITDRRRGIGCDQLLVAELPGSAAAQVKMRIYNTDGSEAGQCGNGLRCFSSFMREQGLVAGDQMTVETRSGLVHSWHVSDGVIGVDMGRPRLGPAEVPLADDAQLCPLGKGRYRATIDGRRREFSALSMGNPHAVLQVDDVDVVPVAEWGAMMQSSGLFPEGVNVGFLQPVSRSQVRLRVFERGVGETLACGTGACAAVVSGRLQGLLDAEVIVELPGGRLCVSWPADDQPVRMSGPSTRVFGGYIEL